MRKKTPCGSFKPFFICYLGYVDDPIWRVFSKWVGRKPTLPREPTAAAWGLWLLRHLACLQRLLGWPVEGFDQRTHLGEEMELNPEKWGNFMQFLKHSNRSSVPTFLGEKEAAQSFFVCIYSLKKPCFFFHTPSWRGPNKIPFGSGITDTKFGRLVVRPDSGDPAETCCSILKPLGWRWDFLHTESVWMFPKIMASLKIIHFNRVFHYKLSILGGFPLFLETPKHPSV